MASLGVPGEEGVRGHREQRGRREGRREGEGREGGGREGEGKGSTGVAGWSGRIRKGEKRDTR